MDKKKLFKLKILFYRPVPHMGMNRYNYNQIPQQYSQNKGESFDDRHVIFKHNLIYPTQDEVNFHKLLFFFNLKKFF